MLRHLQHACRLLVHAICLCGTDFHLFISLVSCFWPSLSSSYPLDHPLSWAVRDPCLLALPSPAFQPSRSSPLTLLLSYSPPLLLSSPLTLLPSYPPPLLLSSCLTLLPSHSPPVLLSSPLTLLLSYSPPLLLSSCLTACCPPSLPDSTSWACTTVPPPYCLPACSASSWPCRP